MELFGAGIEKTRGHNFNFLFGSLTDTVTRHYFPSQDNDVYMISKEENITNSLLSPVLYESRSEPKEFTAVLYDNNLKTITCRVTVIPISSGEEEMRDPATVHFGVCIQELFNQEMHQIIHKSQRSLNEDVFQSLRPADLLPQRAIEKFQLVKNRAHLSDCPWIFSSPLVFPPKFENHAQFDKFKDDYDVLSIL